MTRKHSPFMSPFNLYMDMWRASVQAGELFLASAEVISHRSQMINKAFSGEIPLTTPEFSQMWQEKAVANYAAWNAMARHLADVGNTTLRQQLDMVTKGMRPYHKKARSNAKRLRK